MWKIWKIPKTFVILHWALYSNYYMMDLQYNIPSLTWSPLTLFPGKVLDRFSAISDEGFYWSVNHVSIEAISVQCCISYFYHKSNYWFLNEMQHWPEMYKQGVDVEFSVLQFVRNFSYQFSNNCNTRKPVHDHVYSFGIANFCKSFIFV